VRVPSVKGLAIIDALVQKSCSRVLSEMTLWKFAFRTADARVLQGSAKRGDSQEVGYPYETKVDPEKKDDRAGIQGSTHQTIG